MRACSVVVPSDLTFAEFGKTWIEREREDRIGDWKSERPRVGRLAKLVIDGDTTLGTRPIGRITVDDVETAFRKLEARG